MNVRLLRRIQRHISEEPKRLAMGFFIERKSDYSNGKFNDWSAKSAMEREFAPCGTAACIAGWAVLLHDKKSCGNVRLRGAELLGIDTGAASLFEDGGQAMRLFETASWPEKFRSAYERAKHPKSLAKVAVARIEHFIATKGKE